MSEQDENTTQPTAGWPGGWYVYENGRVEGPFSASETFKLGDEATDGKPRLVSRKGFTQWYALKDLSEIFRMTDDLGRKVQQHGQITEAQFIAAQVASPAIETQVATPKFSPPEPPVAAKKAVSKKHLKIEKRNETKPVLGDAVMAQATEPALESSASDDAEVAPVEKAPSPIKTGASKLVISGGKAKALMMQEYFLARGRLRLGKIRNPWMSAFVGMPLTLGIFWPLWMRDLAREVAFHARGNDKAPLPPVILAMIPFLHMFMAYKLAKLIVEMEAQNRYRSVSPWVAAMFAIFPPFAVAYLQDAVNRHWLLHVQYAMVKKRGVTE